MPRKKLTPDEAIDIARRDARIIELRRAGWHWQDIADNIGISKSQCFNVFERYRKEIPQSEIAAWREEELDLLGKGIQSLLERLANPNMSDRSAAECWREVRQHSESRRRMLGTDAPQKREIATVDGTSWETAMRAEIAQTEREIAELERENELKAQRANEQ